MRPTDLIVRKSDILVWDGAVHTLQSPTTNDNTPFRGLEEVSTRAADDETVVSAFAQMGSLHPGERDRTARREHPRRLSAKPRRALANTSPRAAPDRFSSMLFPKATTGARIEVHRQGESDGAPMARLAIKVRDRLGAVEFLEIDHSGRMFVFAENIPVSAGTAGAFVARYSARERLKASTNCR